MSETNKAESSKQRWLLGLLAFFIITFIGIGIVAFRLSQKSNVAPHGLIIASFRTDFLPNKPKDGWRYLWNVTGPVGQASNYAELRWNGSYYVPDETAPSPNPAPAKFLCLGGEEGHPGYGTSQDFANFRESCVIVSYAIRERARYWLANGFIDRSKGGRRGSVHLQVFVNDLETGPSIYCSQTNGIPFDRPLGTLSAGDTIYVTVGPNEADFEDWFHLDFAIVRD